jgi:hypothetical protein
MCPPGAIDPPDQRAPRDVRKTSGGILTTAVGAFFNAIQSLPNGLRAVVIVVIAGIAGFILYERYVPASGRTSNDAPSAYTGGIPDPTHLGADSTNPQNIEAGDKASEDETAVRWHLISHQSDDNPQEMAIDADRQLFYRYFSKTDHCIFVRRRIGDHDVTQWVKDPEFHLHEVHSASTHAPRLNGRRTDATNSGVVAARSLGGLLAVVSAATEPAAVAAAAAQSNACPNPLNPHPGQYRYWWGPPIDQCNSPMYRQFVADGCTHYQVYNRCANSWDSRIVWTSCAPQHRW